MNRRELIRSIGAVICAGLTPKFVPGLLDSATELTLDHGFMVSEGGEGDHYFVLISSTPDRFAAFHPVGSEVRLINGPGEIITRRVIGYDHVGATMLVDAL